jgi:hypothetical protein
MNTAYLDTNLSSDTTSRSGLLRTILLEPILTVASAAFWLVALPLVAISLACVKVWDTLVALQSSKAVLPNPLILRRGRPAQHDPALSTSRVVRASHI